MPGLVDRLLEDDDVFDLRDEIEALGNVAQVFSQYGYTFNPRERRYEKIFPMNPAWTVGEGEGRFEWTALRVNVTPSGQTWFVVLRSGVGTPREWKFEASWDNLSSYKFQPDSSAPTVALSTVLHNVEQLMQERQSYTGRVQDFVSAFKRTLPVVEALVAHLLEDDVEVDADDISRAASVTEIDVLTLKELRSVFSRMGYTSSAYRRKTQDEVLISGTPSGPDRPVTRTDLNTVADRVKAILDRSGIRTLEATVFAWNRKLPAPGVPDYETIGRNRIYVTIVNNPQGSHTNNVNVHGDVVEEGLEDDFDSDDALHGMTLSADEAREVLERFGYGRQRPNLYSKFVKELEHPNGTYALSIFVAIVGDDKAAFVFLGRNAESTQRLGMANSWIKAFPNDLERFLPALEDALRLERYQHTDQVLTFKLKNPKLVMTALDTHTDPLW